MKNNLVTVQKKILKIVHIYFSKKNFVKKVSLNLLNAMLIFFMLILIMIQKKFKNIY